MLVLHVLERVWLLVEQLFLPLMLVLSLLFMNTYFIVFDIVNCTNS